MVRLDDFFLTHESSFLLLSLVEEIRHCFCCFILSSLAEVDIKIVRIVLSSRSMREVLVLKNCAGCTSQTVKPTSEARVINIFFLTLSARKYEAVMASDQQSAIQPCLHCKTTIPV